MVSQGALEKGLFSIQGGGAAVVTKLGEGGGKRRAESEGQDQGGDFSPPPSR